eukprot:TRINITY_DN4448_c0_g2_i5.p1 TRINITY_DN4448_c0_g2~~TRINITY_DN4448_c0_g2_i5.p1  ORF type:complete len:388 (-),score=86.24 TRINITY_DN4448_c0_g2_i5:74-1237(-)
MFVTTSVHGNGKYAMRLYSEGSEKIVEVDDYFPCYPHTVPFLRNKQNVALTCQPLVDDNANKKFIWPLLVEKMLAKEYGSYKALASNNIDFTLTLITGNPSFCYNMLSDEVRFRIVDNSFWLELQELIEKGFLCGGVTLEEVAYESIAAQHGYAVLDAFELDGEKILQLSEPQGAASWSGVWSLNSRKWTGRFKGMVLKRFIRRESRLRPKDKPLLMASALFSERSFFILWEEFIGCFEVVFVSIFFDDSWSSVKILDQWSERQTGGSTFCLEAVSQNPQYLLVLPDRTEVFFLLVHQLPTTRRRTDKFGFAIHKYEGKLIGEGGVMPSLVAIGRYSGERVISLNCALGGGQYVILVSTYEPEQCGPFTFTMWYPKKNRVTCLKRLN